MNEADIQGTIMRLLRERLEQFNVPGEIIKNLRDDIMEHVSAPEKKPFGACVMTAEASMAADRQIKKQGLPGDAKPRIV